MENFKALVRPFMAISGWVCICVIVITAWTNGMIPLQMAIGILSAPGAVYITDRTISKHQTH